MFTRRTVVLSVAVAAFAGPALAGPAAAAPVKQHLTIAKDPAGDGPTPARDIIETIARYKDDGSILFVVTVAAPIDPVNADAAVVVSVGSSCNTVLGLGVGLFSAPDKVEFAPDAKKKLKVRTGRGAVTSNVFTFVVKHPTLAGWSPKCYAVAIGDPAATPDKPVAPFDTTGEVALKPRV